MVLGNVVSLDGPEGAKTDVQRDIRFPDALGGELVQKLLRKVKPCGRRGGRTVDLGIDGLIALAVLQLFLDIRRQRHFTEPFKNLEENTRIVELHKLVAVLFLSDDGRGQLAVAEGQLCAGVRLAARLGQAFPDAIALILEKQDLDGSAGRDTVAKQPRRQDTGVIHDQTVARLQKLRKIIKMPVGDLAGFAVQRHEARGVPPLQRRLRDQLLRKLIVKIVSFQQTQPFLRTDFFRDSH